MHGRCTVPMALGVLISVYVYCDDLLKIKNAAEAMSAIFVYLRGQDLPAAPAMESQWQEKTVFSGGPGDLVTTSKQFTSGNWVIEVYHALAPLRNTVYQVSVFSSADGWYWKGDIKADGSIREEIPLKQLSAEEKQKMAEDLLRKTKIPPPIGGYGH